MSKYLYFSLGRNEDETSSTAESQLADSAAAESGSTSEEGSKLQSNVNQQRDENNLVKKENLSPDSTNKEQFGEQHWLEPALLRKRRGRRPRRVLPPFTLWQVAELEAIFQETHYPDRLTRRVLSRHLQIPEDRVQVWFNNRRAKQRYREKRALLRRFLPPI